VRHGPSGFVAAQSPEPMVDRTDTTVMQGYVEGSNVSAVAELVRLITVQRSFESASALISERESALSQTVRAMEMR
jgi:flagellar basal-body rod protein FlgF